MILNRIRLKLLLMKYQKELKNGNNSHIKDIIFIQVFEDLLDENNFKIIKDITLKDLMGEFSKTTSYKVPNINKIKDELDEIKKYDFNFICLKEEIAFLTWIYMLLDYKFIKVGETINPENHKLINLIDDEELKKLVLK